jgi:hypothetical protein
MSWCNIYDKHILSQTMTCEDGKLLPMVATEVGAFLGWDATTWSCLMSAQNEPTHPGSRLNLDSADVAQA